MKLPKIFAAVCLLAAMATAFFFYYRGSEHRDDTGFGQIGANRIFDNADAGYSLATPADWRIEKTRGTDIAIYPVYASSAAVHCRIEISSFPGIGENDSASWIGDRLGADPAAAVAEMSSEQITVGGVPAIRWSGTVDYMPAIRIYAFASEHALEFAPSITDGAGGSDGITACEEPLNTVTGGIRFFPGRSQAFTTVKNVPHGEVAMADTAQPSLSAPASTSVATGSVLGAYIAATGSAEVATSSISGSDEEDCL